MNQCPCAQCRERWHNHLRPNLNKGDFTEKEDSDLVACVQQVGTWCVLRLCPMYSAGCDIPTSVVSLWCSAGRRLPA